MIKQHLLKILPVLRQKRTFSVLFFVALFFYILVLLLYSVQSQEKLKSVAEERFYIETKNTANILGNFLEEQKNLVETVATGNEIENYLVNQSLGMSLEYGLNVNLYSIKSSFDKKVTNLKWFDEPIYQRIVFLDENDKVLVDTQQKTSSTDFPPLSQDPANTFQVDGKNQQLIFQAPVIYRGLSKGRVITVANLNLLFKSLQINKIDPELHQLFIFNTNQILYKNADEIIQQAQDQIPNLPIEKLEPFQTGYNFLQGSTLKSAMRDSLFVLKNNICGDNFQLITVVTSDRIFGKLSSNVFLYIASLVPIIILIGLLSYFRMRKKTQELETNFELSSKNINTLSDANTMLANEISRRIVLENDLRESEVRYRTYIEHAPEGILVVDYRYNIVDVNPSLCKLLGLEKKNLIGFTIGALTSLENKSDFTVQFKNIIHNKKDIEELVFITATDAKILMQLKTISLPNDLVMSFCVDITQKKEDEENIHQLAYYDALTGLPNRRLLQDRLRQALNTSKRDKQYVVLMMLDMDDFKSLNDTLGHDVGDMLLTMVASRLSANMREIDVVARIGGDEFVVIAQQLGSNLNKALIEAKKIANKLIQEISQPYPLEKNKPLYYMTCSFGLTLFKGGELSTETLIKQADLALYQAKNDGRNNYKFFDPTMQEAIHERSKMESAMRTAIEKNQMRLYCQPMVNHAGNLVGGEILLRWFLDGQETPVMPNDFIPLAESSALIIPIGDWVIEQSLQYLKKWQSVESAKHLKLSINLSARQFLQPSFVQNIKSLVEQYGVDPKLIKLELTESSIIQKLEEVIPKLNELNEFGIQFSLDDFGTGFSSLAYLKILPISQVKIDQSFVRDISTDANDAAIVSAIVAICQSLDLEVVAEGVENQSQIDFLYEKGCHLYQGFHFGKPVPIDHFIS